MYMAPLSSLSISKPWYWKEYLRCRLFGISINVAWNSIIVDYGKCFIVVISFLHKVIRLHYPYCIFVLLLGLGIDDWIAWGLVGRGHRAYNSVYKLWLKMGVFWSWTLSPEQVIIVSGFQPTRSFSFSSQANITSRMEGICEWTLGNVCCGVNFLMANDSDGFGMRCEKWILACAEIWC